MNLLKGDPTRLPIFIFLVGRKLGHMKTIKDYTGKKYGKLIVLEFIERKNRKTYWKCRCKCGNKIIIPITYLTTGDTKSCGCLRAEKSKERCLSRKKIKNKRLYSIWIDMRRRCYNSNRNSYKYYGNKGIKVCDEWKNNFMSFYNWAIINGYKDNLTIDRIDVNGNYEPNNCRWATLKEQANNTNGNHYVLYKNKKMTLKQFSENYNINYDLVKNRIRLGWDIEKILNTPIKNKVK